MNARLLALLSSLLAALALADAPTKDTSAWWGHIKVLASDDFQGRLTGSPGYAKAAAYVADEFRRFGLRPAGTQGYFQPVHYEVQSVLAEKSSVSLVRPSGTETLAVGDDLIVSARDPQRPVVSAPLVFVGYGLHLPEAGYDDYDGLSIKGAIVVYIIGGPGTLTGAQRAHGYAENFPLNIEAQGALGYISITAPKDREVPWARQKAASVHPGMVLSEVKLRRYRHPVFGAAFNETVAEKLFRNSGHSFEELTALAAAHKPLPRFPLEPRLEAHVATVHSQVWSSNVVAELPGSDPALAGEAVALSAHLDHLGTGKPDHGDGIFHGAMDDGSGVASLLEIARAMHDNPSKPRRSILFVAVSGEEKGLLGSRYFTSHPSRHAGAIVADINMDMFLPLVPLKHLVGFGADESSLGTTARAVAATLGVDLVPDPQPDHLIFVRSDQYNFVRHGIPALMLDFSPEPGTEQEKIYETWLMERYHAQADNLDQPVDLAAADAFDGLLVKLIRNVADANERPTWNADSFFGRFSKSPRP
jgi:Zn-dependent M28 family amino/carboxypeptidase